MERKKVIENNNCEKKGLEKAEEREGNPQEFTSSILTDCLSSVRDRHVSRDFPQETHQTNFKA